MSPALKLAARELRGGLRGFRILMTSLALGVGAIAIVQSLAGSVEAGLRSDGRKILGGDVGIHTAQGPLEDAQLEYLRVHSSALMSFVETRAMARREDGESSTLVEFKAVDEHYPMYGEVVLFGDRAFDGILDQRDGVWGAVVEPLALQRLGVSVGAVVKLGGARYEIRAVLEHEPDRAGSGGAFGFGPRLMASAASLPDTGLLQRGTLARHRYRLKLPDDVDVEAFRGQLDRAFPEALWHVRDYRRPAARVERMIDRLTLFFTMVGLTTLLVGGVGVSNAVKTYIDGKIRSIAMLKCVGATGDVLFRAYTLQVLALASGGIVIGLAVGAAAPWLLASLLGEILPVPFVPGVYPGALLIAACFGLFTTLAFAAWPLARTHEVPPAALFRSGLAEQRIRVRPTPLLLALGSVAALAALTIGSTDNKLFAIWFILGSVAVMALLRITAWLIMRWLPRVRRPRHPGVRLAIANMHRPGTLTPDVVLSLGLGLTVLVAVALVQGNLDRQINESIPAIAPAFFFVDIQSDQIEAFERTAKNIAGTGELLKVPYLRGRILQINDRPAESALTDERYAWLIHGDRGLTYAADAPPRADIVAGEWWPPDYRGPPLLSIHKDVASAFDIGVGDSITLNVLGRKITGEIANVRDLPWRSLQINFAIMFSPEPLRQAPHAFIATLNAEDGVEDTVQHQLTEAFPNVTAIRIKDALDTVNTLLARIGAAIRGVASIALVAGTLVLAGAIAAGHRRRVYESVLMKVFGATRGDALKSYLLEYSLLGLLTASIAVVAGTLAAWGVLYVLMDADWLFVPSAAFGTAALCTGITLVLGFIGTWRALGRKAAPLLRNQ
ncbi:MAG: ABC transporter permease [Gammaproteobacteria bacterium]|nr:ABC transporter permease [Gammaproteobacteria bacterium]